MANEQNTTAQENESSLWWGRCLDGAAVGGAVGALGGAKYGFKTGTVGAIATGGLTAPVTIALATAGSALVGGAGGAVVGCLAWAEGREALDENLTPSPTPNMDGVREMCKDKDANCR